MLALVYVGLRFIHFAALMLVFGNALYSVWLAPSSLHRLMALRFALQQRVASLISLAAALLMFMLQGGLMGDGWGDVFNPQVWHGVLGTQFGSVWLWQIILASITVAAAWLAPLKGSRLLLLAMGQFVLLAGVGHATMNEGPLGLCSVSIMPFICYVPQPGSADYCRCCSACIWQKGAGRTRPSTP